MKKLVILIYLLLDISFVFPFFYRIDLFTDGIHNYFLLSDCHESFNSRQEVSDEQRCALLKWGKILDAVIVVEDVKENEQQVDLFLRQHKSCYKSIIEKYPPSPMLGLVNFCRIASIPAYNIEFRRILLELPLPEVISVINRIIEEIKSCNNTENPNYLYQSALEEYSKMLEIHKEAIGFVNYYNRSIKEIDKICTSVTNKIPREEFKHEYKDLITNHWLIIKIANFISAFSNDSIWSCLFDARIFYYALNQKKTNIIIAAGGTHIHSVRQEFERLNYKSVYSSGDLQSDNFRYDLLTADEIADIYSSLNPINLNLAFSQIAKWKLKMANPIVSDFEIKNLMDTFCSKGDTWLHLISSKAGCSILACLALSVVAISYIE